MFQRIAKRIFGVTRLEGAFADAESRRTGGTIFARFTESLDLRLIVSERDVRRIPARGPLVVVANHPTGAAEGIALTARLETVREDVKVLGHPWFATYPSLAERMFLVDPCAKAESRRRNFASMREAGKWVAGGGALVVFPAGSVARFRGPSRGVTDARWQSGVVRLLERSPARVLPVHVSGSNGLLYHLLSLIHPRLGALLLAREALAKRGKPMTVRIGRPLRRYELPWRAGRRVVLDYLRQTVFGLVERTDSPAIRSSSLAPIGSNSGSPRSDSSVGPCAIQGPSVHPASTDWRSLSRA